MQLFGWDVDRHGDLCQTFSRRVCTGRGHKSLDRTEVRLGLGLGFGQAALSRTLHGER